MNHKARLAVVVVFALLAAGCATVAEPQVNFDPSDLRFSGEQAFAYETDFVSSFPYRHSGQPNNRAAAESLFDEFTALGLRCEMQEWQVVIYSVPVDLRNVACDLPGQSQKQIVVIAHFDQSPDTIEGADNDASGIAILVQLAEIFASEETPAYTITFLATDAEEYGMLGTGHYVQTHPDVSNILAGFSNDNLGREYYDAMNIELIGQYRNYGPIWLALNLRQAAAAADLWQVNLRAPMDQVLDQAGPISFMDQGPLVAAGIPALGLAAHVPSEYGQLHFDLWHRPGDSMEHQTAESLAQSGLIAEAFIRQLQTLNDFPRENGPYLYFDDSHQILRGFPLYLIFGSFIALFFVGAAVATKGAWGDKFARWQNALPHLLSLWLPLLGSIVLTYAFVAVGLMDKYDVYPATSKDAHIYNPRWPAVILFVLGMAVFLYIGRKLAARYLPISGLKHSDLKGLAFFVIGLMAIYIAVISPFSLLFLAPTLFWLLTAGRRGAGKALDVIFFLLGGLVFYGLFYFFGFVIYDYNFNFAWFMLMMFSIQMTSFRTAIAITAIVGAGLSLIVNPPKGKRS